MAMQGYHSSADFIRCGAFNNFVRAVTRLRTAHFITHAGNTYSPDGMYCRCADNNTAMGRLVA
jgi:hypothetical protein